MAQKPAAYERWSPAMRKRWDRRYGVKEKKPSLSKQIAQQVGAAAGLRFGDAERLIDTEMRKTVQHRGTVDQIYSQLSTRLADIEKGRQQGVQEAIGRTVAAQAQIAGAYGQAPAAQTGNAHLDAQLAAQHQGGAGALAGQGQRQAALQGNLGLAEFNELSRRDANLGLHKAEAHAGIDAHLRKLTEEQLGLKKDKGQFKVDFLRQLQDEAVKNSIAAQGLQLREADSLRDYEIALKGLDMDKMKELFDQQDARGDNRRDQAGLEETKRHHTTTERIAQQNADTRASGGTSNGKKKGRVKLTASQKREIFPKVREYKADASELGKHIRSSGGDVDKALAKLNSTKGRRKRSKAELAIIADLARYGHVSKANMNKVKAMFGGYVPKDFKPRRPSGSSESAMPHNKR